jgi:hypothetical protein
MKSFFFMRKFVLIPGLQTFTAIYPLAKPMPHSYLQNTPEFDLMPLNLPITWDDSYPGRETSLGASRVT